MSNVDPTSTDPSVRHATVINADGANTSAPQATVTDQSKEAPQEAALTTKDGAPNVRTAGANETVLATYETGDQANKRVADPANGASYGAGGPR